MFLDTVALSMIDIEGETHELSATPLAYNNWVPYGCCPIGHSMLGWRTPTRTGGVGTLMETYPLDKVTGDYMHDDIRKSIRS